MNSFKTISQAKVMYELINRKNGTVKGENNSLKYYVWSLVGRFKRKKKRIVIDLKDCWQCLAMIWSSIRSS